MDRRQASIEGSSDLRSTASPCCKALSIGLALFSLDLVISGPGVILADTYPIRTILFGLLSIIILFFYFSDSLGIAEWQSSFFKWLFLLCAIWLVIIPSYGQAGQLQRAINECRYLAPLIIGVLLIRLASIEPGIFHLSGRLILKALDLISSIVIAIWLTGTLDVSTQIYWGDLIKEVLRPFGSTQEVPVYVGPMPDGSFRVMWITSTLLCLGALYAFQRSMTLRLALYVAACAASYTRGIWIALAIGLMVQVVLDTTLGTQFPTSRRRQIGGLLLGMTFSYIVFLAQDISVSTRMSASGESVSIRIEQVKILIEMWLQAPLLGHGFGAFDSRQIRSISAPWSYEMVYVALLMKLGLVGVCVGVFSSYLLLRSILNSRFRMALAAPYLVAMAIYSGTNPYLFNIVGISSLIAILVLSTIEKRGSRAAFI